jgi:ABC-type dipeptide/oligopeptide/nickel transport system permease component
MPPLLTSLFLVFVAARTGWFPIGGIGESAADVLHHLVLPAMAIGLPLAGSARTAAGARRWAR